ncbi:hypothetical protein C4D60_Mb08t31160 [Musa balbisiana]|uniref:Uncharacterized protein n=1 Tax=Musa balbisiana TaxID=52838 RepID=A0A4S8K7V0_MUSBA|nr:hypothetical protein C4D60_Mb08t31160 [Musa balbisiana]
MATPQPRMNTNTLSASAPPDHPLSYSTLVLEAELMGRQNGDPFALHASIALLQERFKQLQRVKEQREQRELQKAWSDGEPPSSSVQCGQQNWLFHPDLPWPPSRRHLSDHVGPHAPENAPSMSLWPSRSIAQNAITGHETDVDTSLHL